MLAYDSIHQWDHQPLLANPADVILITGAAGFIGTRVVAALLSRGFKHLRCLKRPASSAGYLNDLQTDFPDAQIEIIEGNLLSRDVCRAAARDASIVYHLAAGNDKTYPGCYLNSVITTRNLLDALSAHTWLKRFVNVSSISVYANTHMSRGALLDEGCEIDHNCLDRHEAYVYGKIKQDEMIYAYAEASALPYVIVRPGVVFGPGKNQITGRVGIDTFGVFLHLGLNNRIPLTYVDNCADAIVLAGLTAGVEGQSFNIVDDDLPTSGEFLKKFKQNVRGFVSIPVPFAVFRALCALWKAYSVLSKGQLPPVFNPRRCDIYWKGNRYSNQKAKTLLHWQPRVSMPEAMQRFFSFAYQTRRSS